MALVISATVTPSKSCTTLLFEDTAGTYNAGSNTGGWKTPNIDPGDITIARLTLISPSGTSYVIDLLAQGIYSGEPEDIEYNIPLTDLESDWKILPTGKWTWTYYLYSDEVEPTVEQSLEGEFYISCGYKECLKNALLELEAESCCGSCREKQIKKINELMALIKALENAAECDNLTQFNAIKASLDRLCENITDCGC